MTYLILKALSWIAVVRDLKAPPPTLLRNEHRLGSRVVNCAAEQLVACFNAEAIALAITSTLHGPELAALRQTLVRARDRTIEALPTLQLPHLPGRAELLAQAEAMFATTRSLEKIVDRAYELLLVSVGTRLAAPVEQPA